MDMLMRKRTSGFTIVELLIVIVIIGILAAITVVAYNGIQSKARNTQMLSAFDTYEKALRQYKIVNGHYPYTTASPQTSSINVCLGENKTTISSIQPEYCMRADWGGEITNNIPVHAGVNAELKEYIQTFPHTPDTAVTVHSGGITMSIRGIQYFPAIGGAATAKLTYVTSDDQSCGRGQKSVTSDGSITYTSCAVTLD